MVTYQVAYREWKLFCDRFGDRHDGARVRVELVVRAADREIRSREVYASGACLQRLHLSGRAGREYLVITVGDRPARSFVVRDPSALVVEPQRGRSGGMQLRIDSRNQTSMLLRFLDEEEVTREEDAGAEYELEEARFSA